MSSQETHSQQTPKPGQLALYQWLCSPDPELHFSRQKRREAVERIAADNLARLPGACGAVCMGLAMRNIAVEAVASRISPDTAEALVQERIALATSSCLLEGYLESGADPSTVVPLSAACENGRLLLPDSQTG